MPAALPVSPLPQPHFDDPQRRTRLLQVCDQLESIFRAHSRRRQIPGLAYGVVLDGELLFTHSFGVREVASGAPADADTAFRIASMTKSFAAAAIVQLRDAGLLALDAPAADYAPELGALLYPTADSAPITVRQLLSMSAGWPQDDPWADRQMYRADASIDEIYRAGLHFSYAPGVTFEYSNAGYMVLGRIISRVSGMPAVDYITRHLLQPLGMDATVWNAADVPAERLAHGYRHQDGAWLEEDLLPTGGDVAAFAGLFSTVRDLARWVALYQSAWPARGDDDDGPVRRSSLREMQQAWRMVPFSLPRTRLAAPQQAHVEGYGYGLSIVDTGRWSSVGHGGGLPGFGSHMRWAPDYGVGIVALANVTYARVHQACLEVLGVLIDAAELPPRRVPPAPALQQARDGVLRLLQGWDDALADRLFADNFFLDEDRARWRRRFEELAARHGALRPDGELEAENWLRGVWRMTGERGSCRIWLSLMPALPARIQAMALKSTLPPSPAMQDVAERLAALTAHPTRRDLARLSARGADVDALWDRVRLVNILCGPCTVQEVLGGDGASRAVFRFEGPKDGVEAELTLAPDGARLLDAEFQQPGTD